MIKGVIFDLDGVLAKTDLYHYLSWKMIANQNNLTFDETMNDDLRGLSRRGSLEVILKNNKVVFSEEQIVEALDQKNQYYINSLKDLDYKDIILGVNPLLKYLKENNILVAVGSASTNARLVLRKIGLKDNFSIIVDGSDVKYTKPNPEIFLLAAKKLNLKPSECLVVEDAKAGVDAALSAGMKVVGYNHAATYHKSTYKVDKIIDIIKILKLK